MVADKQEVSAATPPEDRDRPAPEEDNNPQNQQEEISEDRFEDSPDSAPEHFQEADEFALQKSRGHKRPRPIPKGSNLPALQNHKHGSDKWGWIGLGIFVISLITSMIVFQNNISQGWPPSNKLYQTFGLMPSAVHEKPEAEPEIPIEERLKIVDLAPSQILTNGVLTLVIEGNVENISGELQTLPLLKVMLKDDKNAVLREWTFKASSAAPLASNKKISFRTSLANPPENAIGVSVVFDQKKTPNDKNNP